MVLQTIREKITGIVAFVILGILVIPFAFVGINSYFTSAGDNVVARVNDQDITQSEFTESYTNYRRRMQSIMGASFDPERFESLVEKRQHLNALIDEELLKQSVKGIGLGVDDARLAEAIRDIPAFQLDGQFNAEVYQARLTSQGLSVKQFEREMREQMVVSQLPASILSSSIVTRSELTDYVKLQDQKRDFLTVLIEPVTAEDDPQPSAEEILAFYEQNQGDYQSEEMVKIEYLELDMVNTDSGSEPDDEFLRNRFEQQKGRFISPEQRLVSHILIEVAANADEATRQTALQKAEDLARRAAAGEDFAELARANSDDIGSSPMGGDLGWMEPGVMSDSFEEAMYALSLADPVSAPVQTGFGFHVIQLREIQPASGMSFEEARAVLVQEYQAEEAEKEYLDKADRLVDLIYEDPTTLDSAALDLGLEVKTAGPFSRAGGEGIAANPDVVATAFSDMVLVQGSVSDPLELEENHMVMIRLLEHMPAAVLPLEEVRADVVERVLAKQALEAAREKAQSLLSELQSSALTLDELAAQAGLEVIPTTGAVRRNFVPDRAVVLEVFKLPPPEAGQTRAAVVEASNGYALVVLENVEEGSMDVNAGQSEEQYRRQIANAAASIEARGFMAQLRDSARVEVFEDRLTR